MLTCMKVRPRILFDRPLPSTPKISLILLDWSCRESFHIFDYLQEQDVPREWFEILWIEYFDLAAPDIAARIEQATARMEVPPVDRWISLNMPRNSYYHKHVMYNLGIIASRGDLVMIGDSDAMVTPRFVRTLVNAFEQDSGIVLHLDEIRSRSRDFYPFNYPSFEDVVRGADNWRDGKTTGLLDEFDPLHSRNYGACFCARREDLIAVGGADEHPDYMGHVCGPYDLTWRLVNFGRHEVWHDTEFLYHVWHPGTDGDDNYMGPHDGRQVSTVALRTRRNGRVMPLVQNPVIHDLREGRGMDAALSDVLSGAIGDRPFTEWVIDDVKGAVSGGRTAWAQQRYAEALIAWQPVLATMSDDAQFLSDLGWAYYFVGSYEVASDAFDRSLALDQDNPDTWRGLGWVLASRGKRSRAIEAYTRAIGMADPLLRAPLQEAHRGRAWAYFHEAQLERAHEDFSTAVALTHPDDVGSLQDLKRGLGWVALKQDRLSDAQLYFFEAVRALGDRRGPEYENAKSGLAKADAGIRSTLARSVRAPLSKTGVMVAASAQPAELPSAAHVRSRLAVDLANVYYNARRYDDALKLFREACKTDRTNLRAASGAGWAALRLGRLQQANAMFKRVVIAQGVDPGTARDAFHGRGWVAYREGRVNDAVKEFVRALRITAPLPEAATGREIRRGLRRARYLAGNGNLTLREIARREETWVLHLALNLQGRTFQNHIASMFARARRG
jgi:tetratricopeptide (TPR) repeat protein